MKRLWFAITMFWKTLRRPHDVAKMLSGDPEKMSPSDTAHLQLLAALNNTGRLIDFLKEDIRSYTDAQVGAAVRKVHEDCSACLEEIVTIRTIYEEPEGASITVPKGYDPSEIKVIGNVRGDPPFKGVLRHRGWKASKKSLPQRSGIFTSEIISPAEVEMIQT